jgi:hypothetical protein
VSVGQPLSCAMSIACSSRWAGSDRTLDGVWMGYEILVDVGDWLVSGRKKGSFLVSVSASQRTAQSVDGLRLTLCRCDRRRANRTG